MPASYFLGCACSVSDRGRIRCCESVRRATSSLATPYSALPHMSVTTEFSRHPSPQTLSWQRVNDTTKSEIPLTIWRSVLLGLEVSGSTTTSHELETRRAERSSRGKDVGAYRKKVAEKPQSDTSVFRKGSVVSMQVGEAPWRDSQRFQRRLLLLRAGRKA